VSIAVSIRMRRRFAGRLVVNAGYACFTRGGSQFAAMEQVRVKTRTFEMARPKTPESRRVRHLACLCSTRQSAQKH
jgi:hypothetical protein